MNKEKLMQFLSEAIDKGAYIRVLFYGIGESKETAQQVTQQFSNIVGSNVIEECESEDNNSWFKSESPYRHGKCQASISHFYDIGSSNFMEEDVNLTGEELAI